MTIENFADRLLDAISEKRNPCCVGLDPRIGSIPEQLKEGSMRCYGNNIETVADVIIDFNTQIIDAIYDIVPAIKPQIAFYEQYGRYGLRAFEETVRYAKAKGLIIIEDAKRNDIGSTAQAYADGHLGEVELLNGSKTPVFNVDAITVNPYLGIDGIKPFIEVCKEYAKGIFILDKTSNVSAGELQDRLAVPEDWQMNQIKDVLKEANIDKLPKNLTKDQVPNYMLISTLIHKWGQTLIGNRSYSSIGAVVGATYPIEASILRRIMPGAFFLVPGYGAQGATAMDVTFSFDESGYGSIVNSSREIIFAYQRENYKNEYGPNRFAEASRSAAIAMRDDIIGALRLTNKSPW